MDLHRFLPARSTSGIWWPELPGAVARGPMRDAGMSRAETRMYLRPVLESDTPARLDDPGRIDAIRRGDERAVGMLYDRHSAMVMGVAMSIVRDRTDAE